MTAPNPSPEGEPSAESWEAVMSGDFAIHTMYLRAVMLAFDAFAAKAVDAERARVSE